MLQQLSSIICQQIDSYLKDISQLSKNFIVNKDIQDTLTQINNINNNIDVPENIMYTRSLDNIMNQIIPITSIPSSHIYIFSKNNKFQYAYNGIESNFEMIKQNKDIMDRLNERQLIIISSNVNNNSQKTGLDSFSFIRSIFDINGIMYGYVEVQQDYKKLSEICNISSDVFIIDANGSYLFPNTEVPEECRGFIRNLKTAENNGITKDQHGNIYSWNRLNNIGLTVYIKHSNQTALAPLRLVKNMTLVIMLIITMFSLFMIYFISKTLVQPIRKLRDNMMNIEIDNMTISAFSNIYNDEVHQLNIAFQDMLNKLRLSVEREVATSKEEAKARFSALQAQIAPHFIHNVLYLISILAQENKTQEVVKTCKELSNMLRYVVYSPFSKVTLEDEINYTQNYLSLQAKNYEDSLIYEINIQEEAKKISLPRLVIQPFVENAITHGFKNIAPPWKISISAGVQEKMWYISIVDNGCGISDDALSQIQRNLASSGTVHTFANNNDTRGMGSMGVFNTVMRLKLMYQESLIFSINRNKSGGTSVMIKGPWTNESVDFLN